MLFKPTAIALMLAASLSFSQFVDAHPGSGPLRVNAITAQTQPYQPSVRILGEIKSSASVSLQSKVTGYLHEKHVTDGQAVKKGDLLFSLEPTDFKIALDKARAQEKIAQAAMSLASIEHDRVKSLYERRAISKQELDAAQATLQIREGELLSAKASVAQQQRLLDESRIYAPFDGVVGIARVSKGDLVQAQSTLISSFTQMNPLWVEVGVTQSQYASLFSRPDAQASMAFEVSGQGFSAPVIMQTPEVNPKLGTITLRAEVKNPDGVIKPGMFVRVTASSQEQKDILKIPQKAVVISNEGTFAYLNKEGTAQRVPIAVSEWDQQSWIVKDGINSGDQVITSGFLNLAPGIPVEIAGKGE